MTINAHFLNLIDPQRGVNDLDFGPGLRLYDLEDGSIQHLFRVMVSESLTRRNYRFINNPRVLNYLENTCYLITVLFLVVAMTFRADHSYPNSSLRERLFVISFFAGLGGLIVFTFMTLPFRFMTGHVYKLRRDDGNDLLSEREIHLLYGRLSNYEMRSMNLIQFRDYLPSILDSNAPLMIDHLSDLKKRIRSLQKISEHQFLIVFNTELARTFVEQFPLTCETYRIFLPARLQRYSSLLESHTLATQSSYLPIPIASSSLSQAIPRLPRIDVVSPTRVDHHAIRSLVNNPSESRSFLMKFDVNNGNDLYVAARILDNHPLWIKKLCSERVTAVLRYYIDFDQIENLKRILDQEPCINLEQFNQLILRAAYFNKLNVIKYLISIIINPEVLSDLIGQLITTTSYRYESEQIIFLFDTLIALPINLYPSFNPLSENPLKGYFQSFIKDVLTNLPEDNFESIRRAINLVSYYSHILNIQEITNEEICPQFTISCLSLAIENYLESITNLPLTDTIRENLEFIQSRQSFIRDFMQTGRNYHFPDNDIIDFIESINNKIDEKLR